MNTTILVCQNRTCKSVGSPKILKAFEEYSNLGLKVIGCGCLGQCGNGPMVLVLPQEIWYDRVTTSKVKSIIERYLTTNKSPN